MKREKKKGMFGMEMMNRETEGFWHEIRVTGVVEKPEKVREFLSVFNQRYENLLALKKNEWFVNPEKKGVWIDVENHQIQLDFVQWGVEEPMLVDIQELMNELGQHRYSFFIRTFPKEMVVNGSVRSSFYQTLEQIFVPYEHDHFYDDVVPVDCVFNQEIQQLFERFQSLFKSFGLTYECFSKPSLGSEFELIPTYGEKEVIEDYVKFKKENGEDVLCFKRLTEKYSYPDYADRQYLYTIGANEFDDVKLIVLDVIEKMKKQALGFSHIDIDSKLEGSKNSDPTLEKNNYYDDELPF